MNSTNVFSLKLLQCLCVVFCGFSFILGCDEIGRGLAALGAGVAVQSERAVNAGFEAQKAILAEQLQSLRRKEPLEPSTEQ